MNLIKQLTGTIKKVCDLSPTAKEVKIELSEPLSFSAGAFVNVFIEDRGETIRRAFSISSSDGTHNTLKLSIRQTPNGRLTPLFWNKNMNNIPVKVMGPLGLNTADKMHSDKVYLFGFGIGAGVVKSLAEHMSNRTTTKQLVIMTGNRSLDEIIYQEFFNLLAQNDPRVEVRYSISANTEDTEHLHGYIQDHIANYDFNNSDVYICGQEVACQELQNKIKATQPQHCQFFIEGFH